MSAVAETLVYGDDWSERWPTEFEELDEDEALLRAASSGQISQTRLLASYQRILALKASLRARR